MNLGTRELFEYWKGCYVFFFVDSGGFNFEMVVLRSKECCFWTLLVFRNSCIRKWFMNYLGSNVVKRVSQSFN